MQFCENNWRGRTVAVKREDKSRMDELRVEVAVNERFKKELVRIRCKRDGHVNGIGDEKLAKSSTAQ